MDGHGHLNLTPYDSGEIAKQVAGGFTSGVIDRDGVRITWVLTVDIFNK